MAQHDVGGRPNDEPIPMEQHPFMPWELRVDALMWILSDASRPGGALMTVDELRLGIESLPAADYRDLPYFAKWLRSMIGVMAGRGFVDPAEVERRAAALAHEHEHEHERARHEQTAVNARFAPGDRVRVAPREGPAHVRTPHYLRGKRGTIERICGSFRNPEELALGRRDTPPIPLYRVRFAQDELWAGYGGAPGDTLDVEIYEHWLEGDGR